MFYSQFILAKKGPLGTIWIAAHLERKLRKNQVADTDIGVSVDSILFPEVPIALRLSSHLLLGVVRIYSRKVNYLFNDCSETLVKIKQAFRSTAVDLPPEASTAPYHSITLPETFDLDDLELPDSSFSHGNYVDHHVTTREQITLQDPVEDTVYLGSQFGLDERFGDGDAPQMGLDFDEDLFADRICSPGPGSTAARLEEDVLPSKLAEDTTCSNKMEVEEQQSYVPNTDLDRLDEDQGREHSSVQNLSDQSGKQLVDSEVHNVLQLPVLEVVHGSCKEIRTPDLNEEIFPCVIAQGPSTPGLNEALTVHTEEASVPSSSKKGSLFTSMEVVITATSTQTAASTFCSIPGSLMGFQKVEIPTSSQQCSPVLLSHQCEVEHINEIETKLPVPEQVQPFEGQMQSAEMDPVVKEALQHPGMFYTCEDMNLVSLSSPQQVIMVEPSKEMPMLAANLQPASLPISSLTLPTLPFSAAYSYEVNASKQQVPANLQLASLPVSSLTMPSLPSIAVHSSEINASKQQVPANLQSASLPISSLIMPTLPLTGAHPFEINASEQQVPANVQPASLPISSLTVPTLPSISAHSYVMNASNQQLPANLQPASLPVSMLTMSTLPSLSAHSYEMNASNQQLPANLQPASLPVSMSTMLTLPSVSAHSYEMNASNQQLPTNLQPALLPISGSTMPTLPSMSAHSYKINASNQQLPVNLQPASLPNFRSTMPALPSISAYSYEINASKQQSQIDKFPVPPTTLQLTTVNSNAQEVSTVHFKQLNLVPDNKQQLHSAPGFQKCAQVTQTQNLTMNTFDRENLTAMPALFGMTTTTQAFPACSSGQPFNLASGYHSAANAAAIVPFPVSGNTSEAAYIASQEFSLPQRLHVPETFAAGEEVSNVGLQGHWLRACNEGGHQQQSSHIPAAVHELPLHGVQHFFPKRGESATISLSTEMQRIPINVPPENISVQSCSFSPPIGMQRRSEGIPDARILTQHCSFPVQAGKQRITTDSSSGNTLLQDFGFPFPRVIESEGLPTTIPARNMPAPMTSQHQTYFHAADELSNALSISVAKNAIASKDEQFETIQFQPQPETTRLMPEIPAPETLRSSFNAVREEPDIFGLKQPMTEKETPREVDKSTIPTKQSAGTKRRHMMDATPVSRVDTPNSMARSSHSNRSMDYLPHDDDVLASILGRTPAFKIRPTPAETVASKRPRPTPRATALKRKALIDVAMVLHGDVIRQQLANTEDIRRVRKKAPCTQREIWVMQKESQAQQIFYEPSIPGLCLELRELYGQVFGLNGAKLPHVDIHENSTETQKTQEPTSSMEPTYEFKNIELEAVALERAEKPLEMVSEVESSRVHVEDFLGEQACKAGSRQNPSEVVIEMNRGCSEVPNANSAHESYSIAVVQQDQLPANEAVDNTCGDCEVTGLPDSSVIQDRCDNGREINLTNNDPSVENKEESKHLVENFGISVEDKEGSICLAENLESRLEGKQGSSHLAQNPESLVEDKQGSECVAENHEISVENKEGLTCLAENHGTPMLHACEGATVEPLGEIIELKEEAHLMSKEPNIVIDSEEQFETSVVTEEEAVNGITDETHNENDCATHDNKAVVSLQEKECLLNVEATGGIADQNMNKLVVTADTSIQNVGEENTKQYEEVLVYEKSTEFDCKTTAVLEAEALADREGFDGPKQEEVLATMIQEDEAMIDATAYDDGGEHDDDFDFFGDANNTEFLVADDDAQGETESNGNAHDVKEDQMQENSGWSARTRAVSRYLKTVFDGMDCNSKKPETENQHKLGLDRLLVGKTRKEAARMFFETLVLKTRDYVHVEQKNSFDDISIYPRAKLMKTNF
eukprot:Gb_15721 [translate_table: standard]